MNSHRTSFEHTLSMRWFTPRGRAVQHEVLALLRAGGRDALERLLEPLRRRGAREGALDLRGVDLAGADLRGLDLARVDLTHANLVDADLSGADLVQSDLAHARLEGARLCEAWLEGADLSFANLSFADLSGARLSGARLAGARLEGAQIAEVERADAPLVGEGYLAAPPVAEPLAFDSRPYRRPTRRAPRPSAQLRKAAWHASGGHSA
ncbi:MAG: pentapeptide repeat-containing protein [Planctomycetes bacterium]|nr:pentapeptide repeat-containing protein [Planctomycetota bacterium]